MVKGQHGKGGKPEVDRTKLEKMLRLCADTAEMPDWSDALAMLTESARENAEKLSDDELWKVAAGVRPPKLDPDKPVQIDPTSKKHKE